MLPALCSTLYAACRSLFTEDWFFLGGFTVQYIVCADGAEKDRFVRELKGEAILFGNGSLPPIFSPLNTLYSQGRMRHVLKKSFIFSPKAC